MGTIATIETTSTEKRDSSSSYHVAIFDWLEQRVKESEAEIENIRKQSFISTGHPGNRAYRLGWQIDAYKDIMDHFIDGEAFPEWIYQQHKDLLMASLDSHRRFDANNWRKYDGTIFFALESKIDVYKEASELYKGLEEEVGMRLPVNPK